MKNLNFVLSLILLILTFPSISQSSEKYVFADVNVMDLVGEQILEHQDVFISREIIEFILPTNTKEAIGYKKISAKEKFLIPGMMDTHAHLPGPQGLDMPMEDYLLLQLANGVTSVRCLRYEDDYLAWKKKANSGSILSPNLFITAPAISSRSKTDYSNASELFKSYKEQGYDHIKYLSGLDANQHKSLCNFAKKIELPFVGHTPKYISLEETINNGQIGIEHFQGYMNYMEEDKGELKSLIELTAEKGVYNCPTIEWYQITQLYIKDPFEVLNARKGLEYLPKEIVNDWFSYLMNKTITKESQADMLNPRIEILKLFKEANATLLVSPGDGAYIVPGFGMLEEMKSFRKGGLNNWEILRAATINGSRFYSLKNEGEIKKDYRANVVLLDANPTKDLENISLISGVMVNGRWHTKEKLQIELDKIKNR